MRVSVEALFLLNGAADFCILAAVSRGFGAFRLRRTALAAALCALYGVLCALMPALGAPMVQALLLPPVAMLTLGRAAPLRAAACALALAAAARVTGACAAQSGRLAAACVLAAPMACGLQIRRQRRMTNARPAEIEVFNNGTAVRFTACVDTGNRLTEPFSGQPVLIASAPLLRRVLPEAGYRQVAYGSLGGGGTLQCFRPERIYISQSGLRRRAPDSWVAVFPHRLPGPVQALAPAEFIGV